jgi:hypothetical protein
MIVVLYKSKTTISSWSLWILQATGHRQDIFRTRNFD